VGADRAAAAEGAAALFAAVLGLTAAQLVAGGTAFAAPATVVSIDGTQMRVISATDQRHWILMTAPGIVEDRDGPVVAQPPCTVFGTHVATCPGPVDTFFVSTGDGHDYIENRTALPSLITTGGGDDTVWDGTGHDTVDLGPGDDGTFQGLGSDTVLGGPGTDGVTYEVPTRTVFVALDDIANDGAAGEADRQRRGQHTGRRRR
jgi:hypothetical protein